MKYFLLLIIISITSLASDIYIKRVFIQESYYYAGEVVPEDTTVIEQWISDNKMTTIRNNWIIIVNLADSLLSLLNRNDSTYVQCRLPFEWGKVVDSVYLPRLSVMAFVGTIKGGNKSREINDYQCGDFTFNRYFTYQGTKYYESDITEWITNDISLDINSFIFLNTIMWQIENYSEEMINNINSFKGFPLASERYFYPRGFAVKITETPDIIKEEIISQIIYEVPEYYKRKDKLSLQELYTL